jgi:hypothetical protein
MASTTPTRRPWTDWLKDRWPTALALGMSALTFGGSGTDEGVDTFAQILPLLPLLYLVVAKLRRRQATWPGLVVGLASVIVLRGLDVIAPGRRLRRRGAARAGLGRRRRAAAPA